MKKVTLEDVAKSLGVSKSTVSYAISGKRAISQELKSKILEQMNAMGYVQGPERTRKTHTIGLLCVKTLYTHDLMLIATMNAIMQTLDCAGYKLLLLNELDETGSFTVSRHFIDSIDGVIVLNAFHNSNFLDQLIEHHIPFITCSRPPLDVNASYVDCDDTSAAYEMCKRLYYLGCKKIALLMTAHPMERVNLSYIHAYTQFAKDYGLGFDERLFMRYNAGNIMRIRDDLAMLGADAVVTNMISSEVVNMFMRETGPFWELPAGMFSMDMHREVFGARRRAPLFYTKSCAVEVGHTAAEGIVSILRHGNRIAHEFGAEVVKYDPHKDYADC